MKIRTVAELLEMLAANAKAQAAELRSRIRQPHEAEAARAWEEIARILDEARKSIEEIPKP